jgi:hypothetical protein
VKVGHLIRRFVGSLWPLGPRRESELWVASTLMPGELALWRRMSAADRRHAVGVARRVQASLGDETDGPVLAAALLHDVGKIASGLGTLARVVATIAALVRPHMRDADGRLSRYLRHDAVGAELLTEAGSDPLTVAWAREHHLTPDRWSVPRPVGKALKSADDD